MPLKYAKEVLSREQELESVDFSAVSTDNDSPQLGKGEATCCHSGRPCLDRQTVEESSTDNGEGAGPFVAGDTCDDTSDVKNSSPHSDRAISDLPAKEHSTSEDTDGEYELSCNDDSSEVRSTYQEDSDFFVPDDKIEYYESPDELSEAEHKIARNIHNDRCYKRLCKLAEIENKGSTKKRRLRIMSSDSGSELSDNNSLPAQKKCNEACKTQRPAADFQSSDSD